MARQYHPKRPYLSPETRAAYYKAQQAAHRTIAFAIKVGRLPRPSTLQCVDCGKPAKIYDHRDYTKPDEVTPVCASCNLKRGYSNLKPFLVIPDSAMFRRHYEQEPEPTPRPNKLLFLLDGCKPLPGSRLAKNTLRKFLTSTAR